MSKQQTLSTIATFALLASMASQSQAAIELIDNGGFETGDLTDWTSADAGSGLFEVTSALAPMNGTFTTPGPSSGLFYAVSSQGRPGTHALLQTFVVPGPQTSVILTYDLFVQTEADEFVNPIGLDDTGPSNQHGRVDILTSTATAFDTGAGVLGNFYLGIDGMPTQPYTSYSEDITALVGAGGTFQVRFAQTDNLGNFNLGVDNVSIMANSAGGVIPEPMSVVVWGLIAVSGLVVQRRRR